MRRNSTSSIGAFHPVVFFTLVYGISLLLAIFVCRTVYYSVNNDVASTEKQDVKTSLSYTHTAAAVTALK
jgi:hypothetical protein